MSELTQKGTQPVASWTTRHLQVSVWERKKEKGSFFDVKICRTYHDDKTNEWRESNSFDYSEMPLLTELIGQAFQAAMHADVTQRGARKLAAGRYPS
jgi:hypothetical protein